MSDAERATRVMSEAERARRMVKSLSDHDLRRTLSEDSAVLSLDALDALREEMARRGLRAHPWSDQGYFPLTTAPTIEGYRVTRVLGIVGSEAVPGVGIVREFLAGITDFVGGRSSALQDEMRHARASCLNELMAQAQHMGADAIVGVSVQLSEFSGQGKSMILVQATGTAVQLET